MKTIIVSVLVGSLWKGEMGIPSPERIAHQQLVVFLGKVSFSICTLRLSFLFSTLGHAKLAFN